MNLFKKNKENFDKSPQKYSKILKVVDLITSAIAFLLLLWLVVFLTDNAVEFIKGLFM